MAMKRRKFLKTLGAGTAGIAAFSCKDQEAARRIAAEQGSIQDADLTWSKAPCRYCGTGCGVEVGVKDGRIMAVRGDEASPVNRGLLCVKGYHLPAMLYGEDRLTHPMLRNANGRGLLPDFLGRGAGSHRPEVPGGSGRSRAPSPWRSTGPASGESTTGTPSPSGSGAASGATTWSPTPASAWLRRSWGS